MLLKPSHYRSVAKESLSAAHRPGRVILIHTGVVLLLSLVLTLLDYFLDRQISNTGGLSGMDQRSFLVTVQSVLRLAQLFLLPFWQMGYTYYTLRLARRESPDIPDLGEGFRRFGPILRLKLLITCIVMGLSFASVYAGSFLFGVTPMSRAMTQEMEIFLSSNLEEAALAEALMNMVRKPGYLIPILICFGVCFLTGGVFLFFRFRLAELWLLDHPEGGALAALHNSRMLMQGNWKAMFRIDLSFWWFYLLELVVTVLGFGDLILTALGIELSIDAFGSYLIFFCLYIWAQLSLYWWKRNEVCTTYAHAYVSLCPKETAQEPQML